VRAHEPLLRVYHQQAESIASNMKLTRDPETLILTTKPMHDELVVQSITRRRKTAHAVRTYPDLLLHLCEVQEFELSSSDNGLRGVIKLSKDMIQANRLWWEVNITSTSATAVLSEGEILELGEIATWNPEAIINRGVVRHLHNLTTEVVTKIDHVGFHNKGAKGSSGTKSTSYQPSVQSYPKAVQTSAIAPDSYW